MQGAELVETAALCSEARISAFQLTVHTSKNNVLASDRSAVI